MSVPSPHEGVVPRPKVLYLLTDEISSVLVRGQLGYLIDHGFDVTVGTRVRSSPTDATPLDLGCNSSQPPTRSAAEIPDTLATRAVGSQGGPRWDAGVHVVNVPFEREPAPVADLRALWATVRLIRQVRPQIVNASTPKAGLLGMLAAWLCRVRVRVYVVRGFRFETANGWRRRLYKGLEWLAARCANHVIFNSRSLMAVGERERVVRRGRGEVLGAGSGNGIDVSRFSDDVLPSRNEAREQLGLPHDAEVIGFVGRLTRDKGIVDLVEVFQGSLGDRPGIRLLLVGDFEEGDPVPDEVRRVIETDERIVRVPWLDHPGVAYRATDVLAFPSYREGLPNVPLEAQLCGVPVVGYAATGTVDAVCDAETGVLVGVAEVDQLAGALREILDDPARCAELGRQAAEWVCSSFDRTVLWAALAQRSSEWTARGTR